jgi:polysaccharide export outer membrane protein
LLLDVNKPGPIDVKFSPAARYKVKPQDNLFVSVLSSNPDMNRIYNPAQAGATQSTNNTYEGETNKSIYGYVVDNNGNIQLPMLGTFYVQGKTLREIEELVQRKGEGLFKDVSTKVRLLNYKVTVVGEVKTPGVFYSNDENMTVIDAIGRAQGLTEFALIEEVLVLRPTNGQQEAFILNLNSKTALRNDGFYLLPDDVVVIKPAPNKNHQLRSPIQNWVIPAVSAVIVLLNYLKNK